jgi:hypothetical protein
MRLLELVNKPSQTDIMPYLWCVWLESQLEWSGFILDF